MSSIALWNAIDARPNLALGGDLAELRTRGDRFAWSFSATIVNTIYLLGVTPQGLSTSTFEVRIIYDSGATSGNVRWSIAVEAITPGDTLDVRQAESFDSDNLATIAVPGTINTMDTAVIALSNDDGIAAGDVFRLRVRRLGNDAADTADGDVRLFAAELRDGQ